jgi:23S rRNA pseudouridine2457 synthase
VRDSSSVLLSSARRARNYTAPVPLVLFNKPYGVLSQFSTSENRPTLGSFVTESNVYPAGRLDADSEGLLLLTDDGKLQARISQPGEKLAKGYWVQVEGTAAPEHLDRLRKGVELKDGIAVALEAGAIREPKNLWRRDPPIRERKNIPTSWVVISIDEGRNRQVRRMTAAVGLPTLRLIRHAVGPWSLGDLKCGETRRMSNTKAWKRLKP